MSSTPMLPAAFRLDFQEWCSGIILRQIESAFESNGIRVGQIEPARLPSGQRRALAAQYLASVDFNSRPQVEQFLGVIATLLSQTYVEDTHKERLRDIATEAGLIVSGTSVRLPHAIDGDWLLKSPADFERDHFHRYITRIQEDLETDPDLAVGHAKELIEATCRYILRANSAFDVERPVKMPSLINEALKVLNLRADDIADNAKAVDTIRRLLRSLAEVALAIPELRNAYAGHGLLKTKSSLEPRHAKLAVGASITLCTFLLETQDARHSSNDR